jgi:spore coat protein U-like protein
LRFVLKRLTRSTEVLPRRDDKNLIMAFFSEFVFSKNEWSRSMKSPLSVFALGLLAFGLAPRAAVAATATASFSVTATVQANCLVSASAKTFGIYNGAVLKATSGVSVTCTHPTPYNVAFSAGLASGATEVTLKMSGTVSGSLGYALASNSQGTENWGQTVGANTVAGAGNDSSQMLSVRGQVSAGQQVASSGYGDTIIVAVTY